MNPKLSRITSSQKKEHVTDVIFVIGTCCANLNNDVDMHGVILGWTLLFQQLIATLNGLSGVELTVTSELGEVRLENYKTVIKSGISSYIFS